MELVDAPGDPGGDLGLARLVVLDDADGVDLLVQGAPFSLDRGDVGHDPLGRRQGDVTEHLGLLFLLRVWVPPAAASSIFLISSMPQIGQVPGLSLMMKGCMEQV